MYIRISEKYSVVDMAMLYYEVLKAGRKNERD